MKFLLVISVVLMGSSSSWALGGKCEESYIPPHTSEELGEVVDWARGGAFAVFAKEAGYEFDKVSYNQENPNQALFNFGRATGTSCLQRDVLNGYVSMAWVLQNALQKSKNASSKEAFKKLYKEYAEKLGFEIYLTEVE